MLREPRMTALNADRFHIRRHHAGSNGRVVDRDDLAEIFEACSAACVRHRAGAPRDANSWSSVSTNSSTVSGLSTIACTPRLCAVASSWGRTYPDVTMTGI